jgi:hypothetical protein
MKHAHEHQSMKLKGGMRGLARAVPTARVIRGVKTIILYSKPNRNK